MPDRRILFISANRYTQPYPVYPLGIAYLSTYLKEKLHGFTIRTFDFNLNGQESFIKTLREFKPHYTGFSFRNIDDVDLNNIKEFTSDYKRGIELVREHTDSIVIIGGSGFSIFPEILFDVLSPDFAIYGEGEESMYELIRSIEDHSSYEQIEGLIYRDNGELKLNQKQHFLKNPSLAFDPKLLPYYWEKSGMLSIQTKRGCPLDCIYCTYPIIEGKKVRTLDTDKIINTLTRLYKKQGINYVFFTDSVFNLDEKYNVELAEKIIKSGIYIRWGGYFFPKGLTKEFLLLLKQSGLTHIEFGTESLSDRTLENYGKHFTVKDVLECSDRCRELDIHYAHFIILAGYGETDETVEETFRNSKKINKTVFFPYVGMRIYPGTTLHHYAIREGKIGNDNELLESVFYVSDKVNVQTLKLKALQTKKRWVFPDEDHSETIGKMRRKNLKGPLWEYLVS